MRKLHMCFTSHPKASKQCSKQFVTSVWFVTRSSIEQTSSSTLQRVSIRESQLNSWSRPENPGIKILKIPLLSLGSFEYIESRLNRWMPASYKGHPVTCISHKGNLFKVSHDLKLCICICISVGPCLCFRVFCCPTPNMCETRPGSDGDAQLTLIASPARVILSFCTFSILASAAYFVCLANCILWQVFLYGLALYWSGV